MIEQLKKYVEKYYIRTEVTKPKDMPLDLYRIVVPEADTEFLLGLGQFNLQITKIRPATENRIMISAVVSK